MDAEEINIDDFTLEELVSTASSLQNDLKRAREELDDSMKELEYMKKKQKVVEIVNSRKELHVVKNQLSENIEEIKLITDNIKMMQHNGKLFSFLILNDIYM